MLRAVTLDPLEVTVAFHAWVTACPLAKVQVTVQPVTAAPPAVTRTSPWKPPGHWFTTEYVAVQAREPPDVVVVVVGRVVVVVVVGLVVVVVDRVVVVVLVVVVVGLVVVVVDRVVVVGPPKIVASLDVALMPLVPLKIRWPQVVSWAGSHDDTGTMSRIGSLLPAQDQPR